MKHRDREDSDAPFEKSQQLRLKVFALSVLLFISLFSLIFVIFPLAYGTSQKDIIPPFFVGNTDENIELLDDRGNDTPPFSFFVVGDTKQNDFFEKLYIKYIRKELPTFGIVLGDFTNNPEVGFHRFFMENMSRLSLTSPLFLIVGDHDIATPDYNVLFDSFTLKDFKETYGPPNFWFRYSSCLFIGVNNYDNEFYLDYLREVLSTEAADSRLIFVFMHIPPVSVLPPGIQYGFINDGDFLALMDEFDVDYVICGNYRSYSRTRLNNTNYIISGGGTDMYGYSYGDYYHALLFEVFPEEGRVMERIYPMKRVLYFSNTLKKASLVNFYPFFRNNLLLTGVIISLNAILLIFSGIWLIKLSMSRRREDSEGTKKG